MRFLKYFYFLTYVSKRIGIEKNLKKLDEEKVDSIVHIESLVIVVGVLSLLFAAFCARVHELIFGYSVKGTMFSALFFASFLGLWLIKRFRKENFILSVKTKYSNLNTQDVKRLNWRFYLSMMLSTGILLLMLLMPILGS